MTSSIVRDAVRRVIADLSEFDDAKRITAKVIEEMTEEERQAALMSMLPRLVRRIYNEDFLAPGEDGGEIVWVRGEDLPLGLVDDQGIEELVHHRQATADGFAQRAQELAGGLGRQVLPMLTLREVRIAERRTAVLLGAVEYLEGRLESLREGGVSAGLAAVQSDREAVEAEAKALRDRRTFLENCYEDLTVVHPERYNEEVRDRIYLWKSRHLKKAREALDGTR